MRARGNPFPRNARTVRSRDIVGHQWHAARRSRTRTSSLSYATGRDSRKLRCENGFSHQARVWTWCRMPMILMWRIRLTRYDMRILLAGLVLCSVQGCDRIAPIYASSGGKADTIPPPRTGDTVEIASLTALFDKQNERAEHLAYWIREETLDGPWALYDQYMESIVVPQARAIRDEVCQKITADWLYRVIRIPGSIAVGIDPPGLVQIYAIADRENRPYVIGAACPEFFLFSPTPKTDRPCPFGRTHYAFVVAIGYSINLAQPFARNDPVSDFFDPNDFARHIQQTRYYGVLLDSESDAPSIDLMCKAIALARDYESKEDSLSRVTCFGVPWSRPCAE